MITKLISMREALDSPAHFGKLLGGPTWHAWRVLLIAIMGEPLTADELTTFEELTGRHRSPSEPVEEFWGVIGRRGGKTRAMAALAAYCATCIDYRGILAPGQRALLPVMAASIEQAQEIFNYVLGVFEVADALGPLVEDEPTGDLIKLKTRVDIRIRAASFRTIRGPTLVAAIGDEIAFWRSDSSANPDTEIVNALRPALATTGGPLIAISSPHAKRGELWNTYKRHFGAKGDPSILVAQAETRKTNPSFPQAKIDKAYERDAAVASAEYGAVFRSDLEVFVTQEIVEALIVPERFELAYEPGTVYAAFVDPSGGAADAFTLAIGHRDAKSKKIILDCVRERRPPLSPETVVREFAELFHSYGIHKIVGDNYAGEWPKEQFRNCGITYEKADKNRSEIYRDVLPLMNSGAVELLDNKRMVSQFVALERRVSIGGREQINHPAGGHDDVANAIAGVLSTLARKRAAMVIADGLLAKSRLPAGPIEDYGIPNSWRGRRQMPRPNALGGFTGNYSDRFGAPSGQSGHTESNQFGSVNYSDMERN